MLLWWETRGCVWSIPSSTLRISEGLSYLFSTPLKYRHFGWRDLAKYTVRCTGVAKTRCSFLPCFLTLWESAVSLDTVCPHQKWLSQSDQQPKKSGSEMNCCPVLSLSASGHSLPSGGFGNEAVASSHGPAWPSQAVSNLGTPTSLILTPTHGWTSWLIPTEVPDVPGWAAPATRRLGWDGPGCHPWGIPHGPGSPLCSSAFFPFFI